jgi:hypothetical protein
MKKLQIPTWLEWTLVVITIGMFVVLMAGAAFGQTCDETYTLHNSACPAGAADCQNNAGDALSSEEHDANWRNSIDVCNTFDTHVTTFAAHTLESHASACTDNQIVDSTGAAAQCVSVSGDATMADGVVTVADNSHNHVEANVTDLTHTTDTSANTECAGTNVYLDGEGNCDTLTTFPGFTDLDTDYADETVTSDFDFGGGTLQVPNSTSLPGTCEVGDSYMDTDASTGQRFYLCESADTWAQQGGGGADGISGDIQISDGAGGFQDSDGTLFYNQGAELLGVDSDIAVGHLLGIGSDTTLSNTACIANDAADRLFHDTDCDEVKDAGEEYIDLGASPAAHAATHSQGGGDDIEVENLSSSCSGGEMYFNDSGTDIDCSTNMSYNNTIATLTVDNGAALGSILANKAIGVGDSNPALAACISNDAADRIFHDTDCDNTKDAGEEFIDFASNDSTEDVQMSDGSGGFVDADGIFKYDQTNEVVVVSQAVLARDSIGIGSDSVLANAACISDDAADRLFHDTDCDETKDDGEEYIDLGSGGGTGGYYATMYDDNTAGASTETNAVTNTWYGFTDLTELLAQDITTDTSDATADHFTIPAGGAGDYLISYAVNADPGNESEQYEFAVHIDGSEEVSLTKIMYKDNASGAPTAFTTAAASGIVTLAAGEEVSLRHRNTVGTGSFSLSHITFTVERMNNGIIAGQSTIHAEFRATTNTAYTTSPAAIDWEVETSDPLDWHSTVTNPSRVTVDRDGVYLINTTCGTSTAIENDTLGCLIYIDGADTECSGWIGDAKHSSYLGSANVSCVRELTAGQYVETHFLGYGSPTYDASEISLTVTLLGTTSAFAGGQFHGYLASDSAVGTGDQNIAWTEDTDPFGWFDSGVSTTQVVVDKDGWYQLDGTVRWLNTTSAAGCTFFLNGSRIWFAFDDVGGSRSSHCSLTYEASAGDYFEMKSYHEGGTETRKGGPDDRTETHFWVTRLPTASGGGLPAGNDEEMQYNDGGALAGASTVTYDGTVINAAHVMCDLYEFNNTGTTISLGTGTQWEQWITATEGTCTGASYADFTNDDTDGDSIEIGASGVGDYMCNASIGFTGSNSITVFGALSIDNVIQTHCRFKRSLSASATVGSASISCILPDLASGEEVRLEFKQDDGSTKQVDVHTVNVACHRIGR